MCEVGDEFRAALCTHGGVLCQTPAGWCGRFQTRLFAGLGTAAESVATRAGVASVLG